MEKTLSIINTDVNQTGSMTIKFSKAVSINSN